MRYLIRTITARAAYDTSRHAMNQGTVRHHIIDQETFESVSSYANVKHALQDAHKRNGLTGNPDWDTLTEPSKIDWSV
jgi:hypothetical protein